MKRINDLAIFGGAPTFPEKLHVGRPNIGNREQFLVRIKEILDRRWLTNQGPYVQAFEQHIAELIGVKHCIAINNATIALEIAIRALDLTGEVIVPSMTFIATAHALQWQGITPVFCDIDPDTYTIDPQQVERLITEQTTGILAVHLWGRSCDVGALAAIARRNNLKLLYDAAHAFTCSHRDEMIGHFGNAEVFSFHATKFINSLEGGAIVTNDEALAAKIRLMQNFGFCGPDNVIHIGTNGKMNEISAAMGLTSLESLEQFIVVNERNYRQYQQELDGIPGISLCTYEGQEKQNYQYIVLEIDEERAGLSRDQLALILWAENVLARRYFYPGCHRMEPYRSLYPEAGRHLPVTERVVQRVLSLPTGTAVGPLAIKEISHIIRFVVEHRDEVLKGLAHSATHRSLLGSAL